MAMTEFLSLQLGNSGATVATDDLKQSDCLLPLHASIDKAPNTKPHATKAPN